MKDAEIRRGRLGVVNRRRCRGPEFRFTARTCPIAATTAKRSAVPVYFSQGDILPPRYRGGEFTLRDWYGNNLDRPPRGAQWVRVNNQFIMYSQNNFLVQKGREHRGPPGSRRGVAPSAAVPRLISRTAARRRA